MNKAAVKGSSFKEAYLIHCLKLKLTFTQIDIFEKKMCLVKLSNSMFNYEFIYL